MVTKWLIERKRDGGELEPAEIHALVDGYRQGSVPDYQMAAFAMAVYFQGMTPGETAALTEAMMHSGEVLNWDDLSCPTADKHSTGGIGDKISLVLAPLAATVGLAVPMISGRGLGLTGGTLDKLESIPNFNAGLEVGEFRRIVDQIGCCIVGQTETLAPADRQLYALRDVTGTVPSIPLITASIMSKKLAEGAATLVFDVKCGRGAFMQTPDEAHKLASSLMAVGRRLERRMAALITDMNRPLGTTIGNALEVAEAIEVLHGRGPEDVRDLTLALVGRMLLRAKPETTLEEIEPMLHRALEDGTAASVFERMINAQGGDARVVEDPSRLPQAPTCRNLPSPAAGFVVDLDAQALGRVALLLGAGRQRTDDRIDPAVGLSHLLPVGTRVDPGDAVMRIHARDDAAFDRVAELALSAVSIADRPTEPPPLILDTLTEET